MKPVRPHRLIIFPAALLTGLALSGAFLSTSELLVGEEKQQDATSAVSTLFPGLAPETSGAGVAFLTKKTRLWLGRSQVVCFYAKEAPDEDRFFSFNADENFLHVLIPPTLAPGADLGYLRVRPLKEGHT